MRSFNNLVLVHTIFLLFIVHIKCNSAPSVIIVGAGPAGIAAASRLLENDIRNITILEAENRIGGRIHTVQFGEAMVDLGAEWCHGETNNIVHEIVKDLDLLELTDSSYAIYESSHNFLDKNLTDELFELSGSIYYGPINASDDTTLGDYFINKYNSIISKRYEDDTEKLKLASEFLRVLKNGILVSEGTFSWFDISANSDFEDSGHESYNWKGRGFKTLLDVLMKTYPDSSKKLPIHNKIILNKEVIKIDWDTEQGGVLVNCLDNSTYAADHVILTVSLGVLKECYGTLFNPSLPTNKIEAIKELGIAAVVKFFFHFPVRWWPTDKFQSFNLLWNENDALKLVHTCSNDADVCDQSWLLDLFEFDLLEKNPNVLEAWFVGEHVQHIELLSDEEITEGVMFVLNKFLGHEFGNITKPDAILRYNWYSNPHFRGTYSYQTVKSRKGDASDEIVLSQPLRARNNKETLLFAGEATSPHHYATVHGAVETGFREADRIISFYKQTIIL